MDKLAIFKEKYETAFDEALKEGEKEKAHQIIREWESEIDILESREEMKRNQNITHGILISKKYYEQFLKYPLSKDFIPLADLIDKEFDRSCEECILRQQEEDND